MNDQLTPPGVVAFVALIIIILVIGYRRRWKVTTPLFRARTDSEDAL